MTAQLYSKSIQAKAAELVAKADKWAEGRDNRTGVRFNLFTSSRQPKEGEAPVVYKTRFDGRGCDCPGAQKSARGVCVHMRAVQTVTERVQEQAARKPLKTYEELFDTVDAF